MKILLKIAILLAGIWAALRPAVYGFMFIVASDSSAILDFLVLGSCLIIVWDAFKTLPRLVWAVSLLILLTATNIGFFHYFRDFGESGPLPYEWLNGYFKFTLPLIALAVLKNLFQLRLDPFKKATNVDKNAERIRLDCARNNDIKGDGKKPPRLIPGVMSKDDESWH